MRVTAATIVMLSHLSWYKISGGFLWPLQPYGHSAVVIFFVLSGFVIAYTADIKDRTLGQFLLSRLSRLYSVVLPALLLTLIADAIGRAVSPALYVQANQSEPLLRIFMAALFVSHTWHHNLTVLSNDAYWSMSYEFWYYVIFAAAFYAKGWGRVAAVATAVLIAGPNILMMFPIWMAGVCTYWMSKYVRFPSPIGALIFALTLVGILAGEFIVDGCGVLQRQYSAGYPPGFSPFDYLLGAALGINILGACSLKLCLERVARAIRVPAGYTFSIYLYHLPLLHLSAALLPTSMPTSLRGSLLLFATLGGVIAMGRATEQRKECLRVFLAGAINHGRLLLAGDRPSDRP